MNTADVAALVARFDLGIVLATAVVLGLCATALFCWRRGVLLLLGYVTIEGVVSALLYPSTLPLLFKDALVLAIYAGAAFALRHRWRDRVIFPRSVVLPMAALVAVSVLEMANPHVGSVLVGLVGLRVTLLYMPLFFVGMALATATPQALARVVRFLVFLSVPASIFGIVEYAIGSDQVRAFGAGFARSLYIVGPESTTDLIYRPAGSFASTGEFGAFLFFVALLCLAAISARGSGLLRWATVAVLVVTAVAVVLQSQRQNWVLIPIAFIAFVALSGRVRSVARNAPLLIVILAVAVVVGGGVLRNRVPHLLSGVSVYTERIDNQELNPLLNTLGSRTALLGRGTGTALGQARYVNGGKVPSSFESDWNIPLVMYGVAGVFALLWVYLAVVRLLWKSARRARKRADPFPIIVLVYFVLSAAVQGFIAYPPQNVYFWLFAGLAAGTSRSLVGSNSEGTDGQPYPEADPVPLADGVADDVVADGTRSIAQARRRGD